MQNVEDRLEVDTYLVKDAPVDDETLARNVARALGKTFTGARIEEEWLFGWEIDGQGWQINADADDGRISLSGTVGAAGDIRCAHSRSTRG